MANILRIGSILLNGAHVEPGFQYHSKQTISFVNGNDIKWIVVNGLLIADRPILRDIDWDELDNQGLVFGKQVTLNNQKFLCRLLQVGTAEGKPNEWDAALDVVGESDDLWNWKGICFWGQEQEGLDPSSRAGRGRDSARRLHFSWSGYCGMLVGFRPALALLPSDRLAFGDMVCALGGQSVLYGKLLEATAYDAIVQPDSTSLMADADVGKLYTKLDNGSIAIDRTQMTVQTIKEN